MKDTMLSKMSQPQNTVWILSYVESTKPYLTEVESGIVYIGDWEKLQKTEGGKRGWSLGRYLQKYRNNKLWCC